MGRTSTVRKSRPRDAATKAAERHDVTRQQIYAWQHELKRKGLWSLDRGAVFRSVDLPTMESVPAEPTPTLPAPVDLRLANGRCDLMSRWPKPLKDSALDI